ncbi:DsbA family protein [Piscirickettsia litoralis]|uniref:Thioredoxin domain-containing protein n=1 Tax=Piscirickettsia litoralis TaxID=1891921 RepID=A0ABX3A4E9_9GAMM|nr:DsbA family protein [Piscirickettsia litoralis]ODN43736.1 hypothetical protein BGC07_13555 [Piscirickettsia litoralis]
MKLKMKLKTLSSTLLIAAPLAFSLSYASANSDVRPIKNDAQTAGLYQVKEGNMIGNPKAKITIIDFFDYQCPYCRQINPVLEKLVKNNHNVRVIFKDYPKLGDRSVFSAKAALAAGEQDKYLALHQAMITAKKPLTENEVYTLAQKAGLNTTTLKADMNKVGGQLLNNMLLGTHLSIKYVPTLIISYTNTPHKAVSIVGPSEKELKKLVHNYEKV